MKTSKDILRKCGIPDVRLLSIVSTQVGIDEVHRVDPECRIYTCEVDPELNDRKFIVPGLGDAGDRLYGTE